MNLDEALRATDVLMNEIVASEVEILQKTSRHILSAGGKRIRPRLLFLSYQAVGGDDLSCAVPLAAAVELVHTATLVHDDINDQGEMRRGKETINHRWGQAFALLTGDFLFARIYTLMAPYGGLNAILAEASVALVEGEALQASTARSGNLTREIYQQIVAKKTASLFRAAGMLGAKLAGAEKKDVDALGEFGFFLGLAFQVVDDLLDLTGDPLLMGKAVGVDLAQGKGAGVAYAGRDNGHDNVGIAVMEEPSFEEDILQPFEESKQRLIADGAVEEGRQVVDILAMRAHAILDRLPSSPAVDELRALLASAIERNR